MKILALVALLPAVAGACSSGSDPSNTLHQVVEKTDTDPGLPALQGVDLSDEAVSALSIEEL